MIAELAQPNCGETAFLEAAPANPGPVPGTTAGGFQAIITKELLRMRTVSVVIPMHNLAYLGEAIESDLPQSYKDLEIIVVDDGSTDDTETVANRYRDKIVYLKQERRGVAAARNLGIRASRGEYVAFLDADRRVIRKCCRKTTGT